MPPKRKEHQPKPVAEFETPVKGLYVYADFETFNAGDKFDIPAGWLRDTSYEELLLTKAKARQGMVFTTPKGNRVTLPVMEV